MVVAERSLCKADLFAAMTPEESWLTGLIWADGCLHVQRRDRGGKVLSLELTDEDAVAQAAEIAGVTYYAHDNSHRGRKTTYKIRIGNPSVINRLEMLGLSPNKSLTATFPKLDYEQHFIRGYFDGDGTVFHFRNPSCSPSNPPRLVSGFEGSREFLIRLQVHLATGAGIKPKKLYRNSSIWRYRLNHADSLRLAHYMYDEGGPAMKRKRDEFMLELGGTGG